MMKKFFLFLAAACMITACSEEYDDSALRDELDGLGDKVESLESQIAALQQTAASINSEIAAMQAIANGIAITKVEAVEGGYKVTFSNGQSYTITNGQKGDKGDKGDQGEAGATVTPLMRIDSEGYWEVSYDGGTTWEAAKDAEGNKVSALGAQGQQGEQGAAGVTPQIGVDAEGYWTVSYDGGQTFERMKDANGQDVKAVQEGGAVAGGDSHFASVKPSDDGTMLEIVLVGSTDVIYVPVGGKALVTFKYNDAAVTGVQNFQNGESRIYTVVAAAQYMKVVGVPDAWTAELAEDKLTVTAPAAAAAASASRATADSASDVSILAVLNNGMAVIVRMQVAIAQPEPEPEPTPTPTPGDAKVFTIVAADLDASALGLPNDTNSCKATVAAGGTAWTYNSVGLHSLLAISNATYQTLDDGTKLKKPCLYFYKAEKMDNAQTFIKNTTALGEIVSIKMTMLENNPTKAENFVVKETVNGASQVVTSATATESLIEQVWNFTAGNNGMFEITNTSTDDLKVVIFEVTYKEAAAPAPDPVALATPVVSVDPASVEEGQEKAVAVAWAAVENAASYDVVFNGAAAVNVTTNAYTIDAATVKALTKGEYKVSVVAKPAADATAYLASAAGEAKLVVTEAQVTPTPAEALVWGNDLFKTYYDAIVAAGGSKDTKTESDIDFGNGLKFIAGGGYVKFNSESAGHRVQLGGTGNFEKCTMELTVAGPGTLELTIRSSSSSDDRYLGVWVDQVAKHSDPGYLAPNSGNEPKIHTIDCSDAKAGSKVNFHCLGSGINVYNIKWTPKQ
ncbi:MAG: hypothetical protein IKZ12_04870 [Alistipes sp.]|nr:hypothetical protein [Alistipes sp.]